MIERYNLDKSEIKLDKTQWFLWLLGLDTLNDRAGGRTRDRLRPLLPLVTRNRRSLTHLVTRPPPPPLPPPTEKTALYSDRERSTTPRQSSPRQPPASPPASPPSPPPSPPTPPREPQLQKKRDNSKIADKDQSKLISAVEVFSQPLVARCLSKNVADKLAAIGEFKSQVETYNKETVKPGKFFKASSELLLFLLDSSIWNAFKSACEITGSLFETVVEKFK